MRKGSNVSADATLVAADAARPREAAFAADEGPEALGGERFAKYLLVAEIAQGGMGEVFLAVQQGLEGFTKIVVVKRVLRHLTTSSELTRMFVEEARLAARLDHPNIVKTYEFGEHEGQYYTVMEFLPGEDLGKVLHRFRERTERMPLPLAVHITSQLCEGLHFAHELTDHAGRPLRLVHRDVNPANLIVTYTGEVKMIDFGVARVDTGRTKTAKGMLKGKVAYMSPEYIQARGFDRRADVFSAGIVLWEALTGRELFDRETMAATMYAVIDDPVPMPSRYRPDVPPALDAVVGRALSRDPADRFATADDMRSALDEVAATLPKVDSRMLGRTMEDLFGAPRAQAMSAIAQSRSLAHNIALVMKRLAGTPVNAPPVAWPLAIAALPARSRRRRMWIAGGITGALGLVAITGLVARRDPAPPAMVVAPPAVAVSPPAVAVAPPAVAVSPPAVAVSPPAVAVSPPAVDAVAPPPDPAPAPGPRAPVPAVVAPPRGTLSLATRGNAVVSLDGAVIGRGSFAARETAAGKHQLVVKIPGRRPVTRTISIDSGRETRLEIGAPRPAGREAPVARQATQGATLAAASTESRVPQPLAAPPPAGPPPVAKLPVTAVAAAQARPMLDVAGTRAAARSQIGPVQQCYERGKMDDGNLRGGVTVRITIAANGSVASAQVTSSTLGSPQVEACITREIARWRLPPPTGGTAVSLSYPFAFE